MRTARTTLTAATALVAALTLAGCATGQQNQTEAPPAASSPAAEAEFNDADVMFAQMMIPHHEQAIEMSDSLLEKDGVDEQVRDLAQQIKDAQQPEIDQMKDWLDAWGEDELGDMGGMDHDMGGMGDGMMSDEDMAQLEDASGAEASRLFLEQMILHHEGAIQMAEYQVQEGENPDAVALAERIVEDQTEEIATMQDLLATI
ncbi:DUF305 domain-containing protein [Agromyces indicus]|uniref:DUF305 domain-containing protein n=1 Tax=Agromyces indicus TaxID=758919 RepID=A0ABU1FFX3_9MICO|nr:DUF305 domain-containing protein [Agromyces indicus]MDR5690620.1 DUF305 domain-containing protein [Agromyces indicus]